MTRNEPQPALYDTDFFTWTQRQAAALRAMPRDASIDIEHVAEEIEDLGKRDLREVVSFLERLIEPLLKLDACPHSRDRALWKREATLFQRSAKAAFTPGMRRLLSADDIWAGGRKLALFVSERRVSPMSPWRARPSPSRRCWHGTSTSMARWPRWRTLAILRTRRRRAKTLSDDNGPAGKLVMKHVATRKAAGAGSLRLSPAAKAEQRERVHGASPKAKAPPEGRGPRRVGYSRFFKMPSTVFLASPKSIIVLSRKNSSFSTPA